MLGAFLAFTIDFSVEILEIYCPGAGEFFVDNKEPYFIALNFLATLFSGFVCTILTLYILQMKGVKILLEADSQKEL